jgi:hypothetical protein
LAEPLAGVARRCPDRGEAMARAFATADYTMQEIAAFVGMLHWTVSRAERRFQAKPGFTTASSAQWHGA